MKTHPSLFPGKDPWATDSAPLRGATSTPSGSLTSRWGAAPTLWLVVVCALLLVGCRNRGFDERVVIPEAAWDVNNRVPLDGTVDDTLGIYSFGMGLRHMENYRYSNLYVFLHTTMPNGNMTRDTIQVMLATPEGRWVGKGSGSMRDVKVVLNPNLRFPLGGTYHFEIEQAMREPVLKGISDIGLFIEKTGTFADLEATGETTETDETSNR